MCSILSGNCKLEKGLPDRRDTSIKTQRVEVSVLVGKDRSYSLLKYEVVGVRVQLGEAGT